MRFSSWIESSLKFDDINLWEKKTVYIFLYWHFFPLSLSLSSGEIDVKIEWPATFDRFLSILWRLKKHWFLILRWNSWTFFLKKEDFFHIFIPNSRSQHFCISLFFLHFARTKKRRNHISCCNEFNISRASWLGSPQ